MAPQEENYKVKLYQSHVARANTETFDVTATDPDDALAQANKLAAEKGITTDFDFEIEGPDGSVSSTTATDPTTIVATEPPAAETAGAPAAAETATDASSASNAQSTANDAAAAPGADAASTEASTPGAEAANAPEGDQSTASSTS
jgi:hypothetical protein